VRSGVMGKSEQDVSRFGPQPDHVRFTPLALHAALFSHCDLFISDGILRNLKEALRVERQSW
jgi:UDP:flavonoid glycosyltransferase YjiC (YdhE family)